MQGSLAKKDVLVLTIVSLVFRLPALNQSLWLDEATSVLAAKNLSFIELLMAFAPGDFHPPLYYLLLKIWLNVFGTSEIAVRMLSVMLGVATVYFAYRLGTFLFNRTIGIITALFLATAPLHVYYSQEARMYALATMFATLSVFYFAKLVTNDRPSRNEWALFVVTTSLLLYTDYLPVLLLPFYAVVLGKQRTHFGKYKKEWLTAGGSILLLLLPWLPVFLEQVKVGLLVKSNAPLWWSTLGRTSIKQVLLVPVKFAIGRISLYNKTLYGGLMLLVSGFFSLLFFQAGRFFSKNKFLWYWLIIPLSGGMILGVWLSVFSYFRFLFLLPAFYMLLAYSVVSISKKRLRILAGVILLLLNFSTTYMYLAIPRFHRENWKGAVSWVEEQPIGERAASIFVTKNQRDPYFYYAKRIPAYGPEGLNDSTLDTIYLVRYVQQIFDPKDNVRQKVENMGYKKQEERDFNGVTIWRYKK